MQSLECRYPLLLYICSIMKWGLLLLLTAFSICQWSVKYVTTQLICHEFLSKCALLLHGARTRYNTLTRHLIYKSKYFQFQMFGRIKLDRRTQMNDFNNFTSFFKALQVLFR